MLDIKDFRLQTNVSYEGYQCKSDASACLSTPGAKAIGRETMSFIQMNVTTSEFLDYATNGHAFCNLFHFDANKKYPFQKSDNISTFESLKNISKFIYELYSSHIP